MKVGDLVDSIENSILAKFQQPMSRIYCGVGVKKSQKIAFFGMLLPLKITITFVLYKLHAHMGLV
jgi:hypothetical protein